MSDTDVVALSERYEHLLKSQRTATTPAELAWIRIQMTLVELQMRTSSTDFFTNPEAL
ncbi:hypothetical protein [Mycobacterium sp. 23]|uniref:hypothetical protein n=1 Tax=Mycobacterium sp. 23 TaxID=3400424 RepID=UPI003AAE8321